MQQATHEPTPSEMAEGLVLLGVICGLDRAYTGVAWGLRKSQKESCGVLSVNIGRGDVAARV